MPWKVRKRACKQKSTDKTGSHVVVKVKRDGGEEQESCHTSEPKAQGALRARYASKNETKLRAAIRKMLLEGEADVVSLGIRLKVPDVSRLEDIYTEIRGLKNVISVRQEGEQDDIPGPMRYVNVFVTFEDDANRDVYNLKSDIGALNDVQDVIIKNYEGRRWAEVEKTYTGGAASKSGNMKENILRKFVRSHLEKSINEMAAKLSRKHFVGGDTGNPVVQKSIDKKALDTYEISKPVDAFAFDPDDSSIDPVDLFLSGGTTPSQVSLKQGDNVTLVSTDQESLVKKGRTSFAVIEVQSGADKGMHAFVPIARLAHNMGAGGKKGAVSGQTLGQAVEYAVAGGLTGQTDEQIIALAREDSRLKDTVAIASEEDLKTFEDTIKKAAALVRPYSSELGVTSARVEDESDTALVDVPAETSNGPIAVHVKYNDPNRLFGLQQKMKKLDDGSKVSTGSPSTRIFRQVRADYVQRHLVSPAAYRRYLKKNPGYSVDMEKELKIINGKGGTNTGRTKPMLLPRQFVRRDEQPGDMVTMLQDRRRQFMNALVDAGYVDNLADEIKANLAPEGSPTYYFKFNNGATKLEVASFNLADVEFDIKPTNDGKMNAFRVDAIFPGGRRVPEVFLIELTSSRRGHPPQVRNGKNYSALVG